MFQMQKNFVETVFADIDFVKNLEPPKESSPYQQQTALTTTDDKLQ